VVHDDPRWDPQLTTNQVWNSDTAESGSGFGSGEHGEWWVEIKSEMPFNGLKALDRSDMPTSDPKPVTLYSLTVDGYCGTPRMNLSLCRGRVGLRTWHFVAEP